MVFPEVITVIGVGVARSVFGWAENALGELSDEGRKVSNFEWGQLGSTVLRTSLLSAALFFGINGIFGTEISVLAAGAGAFVSDFIVSKLSSKKKTETVSA